MHLCDEVKPCSLYPQLVKVGGVCRCERSLECHSFIQNTDMCIIQSSSAVQALVVLVCMWSCIYPAAGPGTVWATSVPQRQSPDAPPACYKLDWSAGTLLCTRLNVIFWINAGRFDVLADKPCFPLYAHIHKHICLAVLFLSVTQQRESPPGKADDTH